MVEFLSPFDTIFVANTHERFEEGCNASKIISSANDGEGIRSPFMNIAQQ